MAWNPTPEVALARECAKKLGANRTIILYTTAQGQLGYASYGKTRALCASAKRLADAAYDAAWQTAAEEAVDG